jgi:hypothetical protein
VPRYKLLTIAGFCIAALVLVACGGGGSSGPSQSSPQVALKSYDEAWADGDAKAACELLADQGRRAVETEMSARTVGGLPLNCAARMKEALELLGPEDKAQLRELLEEVDSDPVEESSGDAQIPIGQENFMALKEIDGSWYVAGASIEEVEPLVITPPGINKSENTEPGEEEGGYTPEEGAEAAEEDGLIDPVTQEKIIEETLGVEFHEPVTRATCPSGVAAEIGEIYTCLAVMESGYQLILKYRVTDPAGHLSELSQESNREY